MSRDQLSEYLSKYGIVETFTLKTMIVNDQVVSRGIAIVQYQTKDQAAEAMQRLPFERKLGNWLDIDFYKSKESRMVNIEKQNNPIAQV